MSKPFAPIAVLATITAAVALAACGGSSSPSGSAASERSAEQKSEAKFADFARCMREHGVKAEVVSGPNGGQGLRIEGGNAGNGAGGNPQQMEAAQNDCARYRPAPKKVDLSPQQKVEQEEALQKFARCMREHGIKVETGASGGLVHIAIHGHAGNGEPNPESPGFQQAQNTCQKFLPHPPGAKAGPVLAHPGPGSGSAEESSASLSTGH